MCLAEACAAVDEQRVVGLRRRLRDCERGRVCKAVRRADHERVEGVLRVKSAALGTPPNGLGHGNKGCDTAQTLSAPAQPPHRRLAGGGDPELERMLDAGDVAHGRAYQAEEVALDPVARALARHAEGERLVLEPEAVDVTEPLAVRPCAERLLEPPRDLLPKVVPRQLNLVLHRRPAPPVARPAASITAVSTGTKQGYLQALSRPCQSLHRCGQKWGELALAAFLRHLRLWTRRWMTLIYTGPRAPPPAGIFLAKTSNSPS